MHIDFTQIHANKTKKQLTNGGFWFVPLSIVNPCIQSIRHRALDVQINKLLIVSASVVFTRYYLHNYYGNYVRVSAHRAINYRSETLLSRLQLNALWK